MSGNYVVGIAGSNFDGSSPLAGYHSSGTVVNGTGVVSESPAPDPNTNSNVDDNGSRQATGFYAGGVLSPPVALSSSDEPAAEETGVFANNDNADVLGDSSNLTVDFGFYKQSFGDLVWLDDGTGAGVADNGLVDGTEAGLDGVVVKLFASDGTSEIPVGPDGVFGTSDDATGGVVTAGGGLYRFAGLVSGSYVVKIAAPGGYTSSSDPVNGAVPLATDSDDNGTGTGSGTITSVSFMLIPGSSATGSTVQQLDGSTSNPRVDFGLIVSSPSTTTTVPPTTSTVPPTTSAVPTTTSAVPPTTSAVPPTTSAVPTTTSAVPTTTTTTTTTTGPTTTIPTTTSTVESSTSTTNPAELPTTTLPAVPPFIVLTTTSTSAAPPATTPLPPTPLMPSIPLLPVSTSVDAVVIQPVTAPVSGAAMVSGSEADRPELAFAGSSARLLVALALMLIGSGAHAALWRRRIRS